MNKLSNLSKLNLSLTVTWHSRGSRHSCTGAASGRTDSGGRRSGANGGRWSGAGAGSC